MEFSWRPPLIGVGAAVRLYRIVLVRRQLRHPEAGCFPTSGVPPTRAGRPVWLSFRSREGTIRAGMLIPSMDSG